MAGGGVLEALRQGGVQEVTWWLVPLVVLAAPTKSRFPLPCLAGANAKFRWRTPQSERGFFFLLCRFLDAIVPRLSRGGEDMAIRAVCVGFLLFSQLGCGTVKNTVLTSPEAGGKTPFGGLHEDLQGIWAEKEDSHPVLCAIDLPFSAIGDVVMLPYTWSYTVVNEPVPIPPMMQSSASRPMTPPSSQLPPPVLPTLPGPESPPASPPLPK